MAATPSTMTELGAPAPPFALPDPAGRMVKLEDLGDSDALLVIFMCNHCPFVIHVIDELVRIAADYTGRGLAVVGINSNNVETHPDDSPEKMAEFEKEKGLNFPYLFDEDQSVAKAYRAACTPDFFLYNGDRTLVYRGQLDGSRPNNDVPVTGEDLRRAIEAVLAGGKPDENQAPSIGCNIKWKPGNEPAYVND